MKSLIILTIAFLGISAQASDTCVFGSLEDVHALRESKRFEVKELISTYKRSPIDLPEMNANVLVRVSSVTDKKTKKIYQLNETFLDTYDGGNTMGWIDDMSDEENADSLVATVGDSEITCLIK